MLTLLVIALPIWAVGAWAVWRWRKKITWHNHVILVVFAISVGQNVVQPPVPGDYLYGLVIGTLSGLVYVVVYLAIIGLISVVRKAKRTDNVTD